jgi:hypothetical protein
MENQVPQCGNVEGALHSPNDMTKNSYIPYFVLITIFSTSAHYEKSCPLKPYYLANKI